MKKQIITTALLAISAFTFAQTKPAAPAATATIDPATQPQLIEKVVAKPNELVIPYEKWRLPNGLTVIVHEDNSDPIVHVEVTYHVGSARETPGKSGFAHFFEHMMFQGSVNVRDEEHFKIVQGAGGNMNGTTNRDRTNYFETMPKNYLETALWLEADRMGFLLDSVTQKKFEVQRSTVKNEKDQNVNNIPYGRTDEVKDQILYPARHPYNSPTIGYVEDLDRVNVEDLKNFFMRWYGPNNASVVVAGDVKTQDVLNLAMKYFGSIPRGPEVKKQRVDAVRLPDNVYANFGDNVVLPLTYIVYPSTPSYSADEPALDLLASILGNGNNSIMYKNLVKTEKAFQVNAFNQTSELSGEFTIQFLSYPAFPGSETVNPEEELKKLFDEFEKLGVSDDDLARAKGGIETQMMSSMASVAYKASLLSSWNYLLPNKPMNVNEEIARYKKVTKEDVMRVFNTYIKGKYAATVNVFAKQSNGAAGAKDKEETKISTSTGTASSELEYKGLSYTRPVDNFDRSKHPDVAAGVKPVVPVVYKQKFDNGLIVMGTQTSDLPMVTIVMTMRGGNLVNDMSKSGLASLTAAMMGESTQKYTSEQFSNMLDKMGSSITFNAGKENSSITIVSRKEHLDETIKLFEEKLLHPKFTADEFKLNQRQLAEDINSQRVNASASAGRAYARLLFGKTIAAEQAQGTIKNLKAMTVKDVQSYYDKYYAPNVSSIVVVGDVSEADVMPKLGFLKTWARKEVVMPQVVGIPLPEQQQIYLIDKYKAAQSEIRIGYLVMPYDYNGKYFKATVMNFPLGGNFNGRLNLNLREDKGITYGIRSGFGGGKNIGPYTVSVGVRATATDTAIKEIVKELTNYRNNGITAEELVYTKKSLSEGDALRYETPFAKAGFINQMAYYDLPTDYIEQQSKLLQTLTKEEIDALAKELLPVEKMIIVIVGDKDKIQGNLEKLGYKVVDYKLD